jgi:hypothetical protein
VAVAELTQAMVLLVVLAVEVMVVLMPQEHQDKEMLAVVVLVEYPLILWALEVVLVVRVVQHRVVILAMVAAVPRLQLQVAR